MDALNAKLAELEKKEREIQTKRYELDSEEHSIERERRQLEEERLKLSQKLSDYDEGLLRKELTAIGELLEIPAVIIGRLTVINSDWKRYEKDLYTISIKTGVTYDSGVTGLSVDVNIHTECPQVEAIVRELFVQEGPVRDRVKSALTWEKNWDSRTNIRLTSHEALSW